MFGHIFCLWDKMNKIDWQEIVKKANEIHQKTISQKNYVMIDKLSDEDKAFIYYLIKKSNE